jgi:hypothetical protein
MNSVKLEFESCNGGGCYMACHLALRRCAAAPLHPSHNRSLPVRGMHCNGLPTFVMPFPLSQRRHSSSRAISARAEAMCYKFVLKLSFVRRLSLAGPGLPCQRFGPQRGRQALAEKWLWIYRMSLLSVSTRLVSSRACIVTPSPSPPPGPGPGQQPTRGY